jgi:hypothetical protein
VILTVETTNTSDMFPRIIEMNRYRFVPLLIVSLSAIAAAAHAQTHHHAKSVGRNAPKVTLAFVTNNPSDYWTLCRKGTEAAAKELGNVSVQFVMPADGTVATQEQDVDDLLAKNVQGIAISPVDPTKNLSQNVRVGSSSYQRRNQSKPAANFTVARYRSANLS